MSFEQFQREVTLLKADILRSGLASILQVILVMIAATVVLGFIFHRAFFAAALFVLLGGSSMYFMRKQKNVELVHELDRELLGRE
ncbi:hypothetical protein [Cerasicoccus fimbriatus]|uniref:hypothetical protein n=1 Tax=Cerasicoccus fimbriatus TaxID=3014554 RepID=UPI0022B5DAB2|nr:hypothetical protein [Cerasicoccus sp. TK19100]